MEFKTPSKLDQYKKLLKMARAGKLGASDEYQACTYRNGDKRCAVGALFNDAQLDDIQKRGHNARSIRVVASDIGCRNIETVTGFTLDELEMIQSEHDRYTSPKGLFRTPFIEFVEGKIKELKGQS